MLQIRRVRLWCAATMASTVFGAAYVAHLFGPQTQDLILGSAYGAVIGGFLAAYQLFYVDGRHGAWLRRMPFLVSLAARIGIAVLIMTLAIAICRAIFHFPDMAGQRFALDLILRDLAFSTLAGGAILFVVQVQRTIGARVLGNIVLGRYSKPVREDRVFLFLDMVGSTQLAQRLGAIGVYELIARTFFEIDAIVVEYGGETHRYIGDELVVTWPLDEGVRDALCVRCVFAIEDAISAGAAAFRKDFGAVPTFRAALHGGDVIAGEIGDSKTEIVYFGDTINTAARIQAECKVRNLALLVSSDLLNAMNLPHDLHYDPVGAVQLRGRVSEIQLFTVMRLA